MIEEDEYILDAIKTWVWSGFYSLEKVDEMIDDILEEGANEAVLRAAILPEFEKKAQEEKHWPQETDCDRINTAFAALEAQGILALHNAGHTMSDGHQEAYKAMQYRVNEAFTGYCFYHGQDVERAVKSGGLMIAFDHIGGDVPEKLSVGNLVRSVLEVAGFETEWNGSPDQRINLPKFDWKRRSNA